MVSSKIFGKKKTNKARTFTERMAANVEGVNSCSGLHAWSTFQTAPQALKPHQFFPH